MPETLNDRRCSTVEFQPETPDAVSSGPMGVQDRHAQRRWRGTRRQRRIVTLVEALLRELGMGFDFAAGGTLRRAVRRSSGRWSEPSGPTIIGLCNAYLKFARSYYRKRDSDLPKESIAIDYALRPLRQMFGRTRAADFGPRKLKEVRDAMVASGWCRSQVNMQIGRVKRMFKWAVSNELVPATLYHALQSIDGLRAGRTIARESKPVKPVPEPMVEAVLPHVTTTVQAMIKLQLLTGMRPGEVTIMRTCDIDRSGETWLYRPEHHKTEQHGHERFIFLGPNAQRIVEPFLKLDDPSRYIFSPIDADRERRRNLHERRKTLMSCGNIPGSNRKRHPRRKPGERYTTQAYGHAIRYGCSAAFPPVEGLDGDKLKEWRRSHNWHPNQLRHNAATRLRKDFGLDVAQVVLGHATLAVTQVYAEKDVASAREVMSRVG